MINTLGRNKVYNPQKTVPLCAERKESLSDKIATASGVAKGNNKKLNNTLTYEEESPKLNQELKIKDNANELMVITKTKKLTAYIITITEKSPKKFRSVFVNRMQNYCLDCLEFLVEANTLKMDTTKNKERRKECQHHAFLKLKLLGYMAFLSLESGCILKKQYEQISIQLADCINLLVAWRKSDTVRN